MIKAVIIEDEVHGLNNLKKMLAEHCEEIEVVADAGTIEDALELLTGPDLKPDLAFLDINLPDGLIFSLLNQIRPLDFDIIFVTAHQEHAIKACEYSSIGFIVKPIDPDALKEAVARIRPKKEAQTERRMDVFNNYYNNPNTFTKMSVSALDGIYFVNIKDIVRLEAEDNYTHIYLVGGERLTASKTIKSYEDMLTSINFYRVHKRHVINLNYMRKFVKGDGGYLVMDDDMHIEVSRRRRPSFMEKLKELQEGM